MASSVRNSQAYVGSNSLSPGYIGPVEEVAEGVFAAIACSPQGEIYYLGMERIVGNEKGEWKQYQRVMQSIAGYDGPLLLFCKSNDELDCYNLGYCSRFKKFFSDMEEVELEELSKQVRSPDNGLGERRISTMLNQVRRGITAFDVDRSTYVAYASKKPITSRISNIVSDSSVTFKKVKKCSEHIIMSVGVLYINEESYYENRGIFRNPYHILQWDYRNISVQLHTFTARFMQTHVNPILKDNKKVSHIRIGATPKMAEILSRAIGQEHVLRGDQIPATMPLRESFDEDIEIAICLEELAQTKILPD